MKTTPLLMLGLLVAALARPVGAAPASPTPGAIRGIGWSAGFRNGTLVGLRNLLVGETFVVPGAPAPLTGVRRPRGGVLTTEGGAAPRLTQGAGQAAAEWPDGVRLTQTMAGGGDRLVIRQSASASEAPLAGVQWGVAEVPADVEVLVPGNSGLRFGPGAPDGTWGFDYPISWEAQFVLLQGQRGGFLISTDDTVPLFKALRVERHGGKTTLAFETRATAPFAAVREVKSVAWYVRPYRGSWLEGARLYREWAEKAYGLKAVRAARPAWMGRIRAVFIVPMEMALLDELAKRVKPAETLLYVPNWRKFGYDRNYPDYTASDEFGPWNERAHALGFRVMPHVNYFGCDPLHPLYEEFKAQQMRDPFTNELQWWLWDRADPVIKFAYINPASRKWRQLFVERMKEVCTKYQIDALHLDQTLCIFNDNNGIIDGMNCMQGNLALHRELHAALPDVALSGEGLDEVTYRYEEFCQRHLYGLNHAEASWSNAQIAMAHPVSSSLFTPHTAIYGYLGMANPSSGGLYQAWRRGYDHFGVVPTLAHTGAQQIRDGSDLLGSFFNEAAFFQRTQAVPDFAVPWPKGALFVYRLSNGKRAVLKRDQGVVLTAEGAGGKSEEVYRRIEGANSAALPGSVPGWRAYDDRRILGLDPEGSYPYSPRPRDASAFHVTALPEGTVVRRAGVRDGLISIRLEDAGNGVARLWAPTCPAEGGVKLYDGTVRRYSGVSFSDESGGTSVPEDQRLFLHPPWRVTERDQKTGINLAKGIGVSFLEYRLTLPARAEIGFSAGVCLREGAVGKSDGATFRVSAWDAAAGVKGGDLPSTLRAETHHDGGDPVPLVLDLSPLGGKRIVLRLETDPGPKGSATFDHALFVRPRVTAIDPTLRTVAVSSPAPVAAAIGPEGDLALAQTGPRTWQIRTPIPGAFFLASEPASLASLPIDLVAAKRSAALVFEDGTEQAPSGFCQVNPIGDAAVAGVAKRALGTHPPNHGQMVVDYVLRLPAAPARLEGATGLRDGSVSKGVGFSVRVNGAEAWSASMLPKQPWKPFSIDLSKYAGKSIVLSLVADSQGDFVYDWAVWAEPRIAAR